MENHPQFPWVYFLLVFIIFGVHGNAGQTVGSMVDWPVATSNPSARGRPKSCADIKNDRPWLLAQTCLIYPFGPRGQSVEARCDFVTDGGNWTVIQKRSSGPKEEFYRGWTDYERGFGSAANNYWLGLKAIRELTKGGDQELRIEFWDFDGDLAYAMYSNFSISDSSDFYRLSIGGFSGTAGDSLSSYHGGQRFSTKDKDNDNRSWENCAERYKGAWWYNSCFDSNLNGLYYKQEESEQRGDDYGIVWKNSAWKNSWRSLRQVEMKVRPRR